MTLSLEYLDDIAIDNPYAPKFAATLASVLLNENVLELPTLVKSLKMAESKQKVFNFTARFISIKCCCFV